MITLNEPKALNSASLEMCQAIFQTLKQWQNDSQIVAVFLQSTGEKGILCRWQYPKTVRSHDNSADYRR